MPLTGVNSYLSTSQEFENHWEAVNAAQPALPIVLPDGTTLADFGAMRAAMVVAFGAVAPAAAAQRSAAGALVLSRQSLQPRFVQLGQMVRLYLSKTRFKDAAPLAPNLSDGEQVFRAAGEQAMARWAEINAATDLAPFAPPLVLPALVTGGDAYAQSDFEAELSALMGAFAADHKAGGDATQQRANRDALLPAMREAMRQYRETVLLFLPKDSPLRATLPRLTPAVGTTPTAVATAGAWDYQLGQARLSWPEISQGVRDKYHIDKLQVRACAGDVYKADEEEIVPGGDALAPDATHFETNWELGAPADRAVFKVYVMTTTGNENGGKAVKIVRPST